MVRELAIVLGCGSDHARLLSSRQLGAGIRTLSSHECSGIAQRARERCLPRSSASRSSPGGSRSCRSPAAHLQSGPICSSPSCTSPRTGSASCCRSAASYVTHMSRKKHDVLKHARVLLYVSGCPRLAYAVARDCSSHCYTIGPRCAFQAPSQMAPQIAPRKLPLWPLTWHPFKRLQNMVDAHLCYLQNSTE